MKVNPDNLYAGLVGVVSSMLGAFTWRAVVAGVLLIVGHHVAQRAAVQQEAARLLALLDAAEANIMEALDNQGRVISPEHARHRSMNCQARWPHMGECQLGPLH